MPVRCSGGLEGGDHLGEGTAAVRNLFRGAPDFDDPAEYQSLCDLQGRREPLVDPELDPHDARGRLSPWVADMAPSRCQYASSALGGGGGCPAGGGGRVWQVARRG